MIFTVINEYSKGGIKYLIKLKGIKYLIYCP